MTEIEQLIKNISLTDKTRIAYKNSTEQLTYSELYDKAYKYADLLRKQGTSPVIIYGHKESDMITAFIACLMAERAYVPVDVSIPFYRIEQIIKLSHAGLLLNVCCVELPEMETDICDICTVDGLNKYSAVKTNNIETDNPNNTAYIIFTSGSSGEPKGVPISYGNLCNFIKWISNLYPLSEYKNICVMNQANFNFDLSVADIYYSLYNRHTLSAVDFDASKNYNKLFDFIANINAAVVTPTFMKLCMLNKEFNSVNYPNLKCVYFCGEQLEPKTVKKLLSAFPEINIINAYGPTEAASAVCGVLIKPDMLDKNLLPAGEIKNAATDIIIENGEIILKGASVSSGYINNTTGGFFGGNCYRTGDLGFINDGLLYVQGRMDRQVKYKGYRIELDEIESVINSICECAVSAKYDGAKNVKNIRAFVVTELEENDIKKEAKKLLPDYMVPKIIKIDRLPVNKNGKIDRKRIDEID